MHTKLKRVLLLVLTLALLWAAGHTMPPLQTMRERYDLSNEPVKGISPQLALATQALAWGRGVVIDVIWIRMEALKQQGRFFELVQLAKWACDLAPRIPQVWDIQAWNMAYNVSCQIDDLPDRWAWVWKGIELLRDQGIPANPNAPRLYESLAMTIFHKIGEQDDMAHPFYKQQFAYLMQEVLGGGGDEAALKALAAAPLTRQELLKNADVSRMVGQCAQKGFDVIDSYFELLFETPSVPDGVIELVNRPENATALEQVAVFARARKLRETYKMDPQFMLALRDKYKDSKGRPAPFDWRSPYPHAIYWATMGLQRLDSLSGRLQSTAKEFGFVVPTRQPLGVGYPFGEEDIYAFQRAQLERMVYFSMQALVTRGRILFDAKGNIMLDYGPDYRFADAALPLFEQNIKLLSERYANSTKDAYKNFLLNAVLQFYFNGDPAKSAEYYTLLTAKFPEEVSHYKSYQDFLEDQFRLFTSSMKFNDARQLVRAYLYRGMVAMALNEDDDAATLEKEAKDLADRWVDVEHDNLRGLIRYDKIRESVIVDFLTGTVVLPPPVLENLKSRIGEATVQRIMQNVPTGESGQPVKEKVDPKLMMDPTIKPILTGPQHD